MNTCTSIGLPLCPRRCACAFIELHVYVFFAKALPEVWCLSPEALSVTLMPCLYCGWWTPVPIWEPVVDLGGWPYNRLRPEDRGTWVCGWYCDENGTLWNIICPSCWWENTGWYINELRIAGANRVSQEAVTHADTDSADSEWS